jgi:arylsulfatase
LQIPEADLAAYRGAFPEVGYDGKKGYLAHPTPRAAYAAMVTRLDTTVGRVIDRLKELGLTERTLVMFTSDNGPTFDVGGADSKFFGSAGPHRGLKGQLYEGGIRVPFVASWPGVIPAGRVDATPLAFWDVLPTLAELAGEPPVAGIDGISFVPALTGRGRQAAHEALYWETPAGGGAWAVRQGDWKAIRRQLRAGKLATELYDLAADPGESTDLAARNPETVARMERTMREQHRRSTTFPLPGVDGP